MSSSLSLLPLPATVIEKLKKPQIPRKVKWKQFFTAKQSIYLVIGTVEHGIQIYEISADKVECLAVLEDHGTSIGQCAILEIEGKLVLAFALTHKHTVWMFSLETRKVFFEIQCRGKVHGIIGGRKNFVIGLKEEILVYQLGTMERLFTFRCAENFPNYIVASIGSRWLAYASIDPIVQFKNSNMQEKEENSNYFGAVAKSMFDGMKKIVVDRYILDQTNDSFKDTKKNENLGNLAIRDVKTGIVLNHFKAHSNQIAFIQFDPSGSLLATTSIKGKDIHIYQIVSLDKRKNRKNKTPLCRLIYRLHRGQTESHIRNISFSVDSKWILVDSKSQSTHLYAINKRGGIATVNSHILDQDLLNEEDCSLITLNQKETFHHNFKASVLSAFEDRFHESYPRGISCIWNPFSSNLITKNQFLIFTLYESSNSNDKLSMDLITPIRTNPDIESNFGIKKKHIRTWNMADFIEPSYLKFKEDKAKKNVQLEEKKFDNSMKNEGKLTQTWYSQLEIQTWAKRKTFECPWESSRFLFHKLIPFADWEKFPFALPHNRLREIIEIPVLVSDVEEFEDINNISEANYEANVPSMDERSSDDSSDRQFVMIESDS